MTIPPAEAESLASPPEPPDAAPVGAGAPPTALRSDGVYGSIAVAVICVAWYGEELWELGLAVAGYSTTLWLAHIYSEVIPRGSHRVTWAQLRTIAHHSRGHLVAAVPALVTIAIGAVLGFTPTPVDDVALVATMVNLFAWELAALRPSLPSPRQLAIPVLVDAAVLVVIIGLRVLTK